MSRQCKSLWVLTLAMCLMAGLPRLGAAQTVEEQIAAVRGQFLERYAAGDADSLTALFDDRASFAGTLQPFWLRGQDAIRDLWERYFAAFPSRRLIFRDPVIEEYGDPAHTAVETGYLEMYMTDAAGRTIATFIRYSITRVNLEGEWLIANMYVGRLPGND
jgi:ketosteroid isomerase-like protein